MVIVNIKMDDQEKILLKQDAYGHQMNVSEYVRWLIEKERERQKTKQIEV